MAEQPKKLYRSTKDRWIGGVCGGLGEYFKLDPTLVRIIFILIALFMMGGGILIYLLLWLIIPQEPTDITDDVEFSTEED